MLNHVAVIPDGNRRWAKKEGIAFREAYIKGVDKVRELMFWAKEYDIKTVTAWGFSTENFRRSGPFKSVLFGVFERKFREMAKDEDIHRDEVRVNVVGDRSLFPKSLLESIVLAEDATRNYNRRSLNIALGYGGRQEILDVCNKAVALGKPLDDIDMRNALMSSNVPDIDLLIRTSGEQRLSGFMPWQTAYSEFYFSNKLWPDFSRQDFAEAVGEFNSRQRRFGK